MVCHVEISQLVDETGKPSANFPASKFFRLFPTVLVRNIDNRKAKCRTIRGKDDGKSLAVQIDYGPKSGAGELGWITKLLAKFSPRC